MKQIMRYLAGVLCLLMLVGCGAKQEAPAAEAAAAAEVPAAEEAMPEGTVVSNVEEFLAALASDTTVVLQEGTYNLGEAASYGRSGSAAYHWESCYDGYELVISDAANLKLIGVGDVKLTADPRYANVLRFRFCDGVTVENLTVGHSDGEGWCTGGVLFFENCESSEVRDCRLYGCGIRGVDTLNCTDIHVAGTDIYECSYGASLIQNSTNVLFENCRVYNCQTYTGLLEVDRSRNVAFINSEVHDCSGFSLLNSTCPGVYLGGLDVHGNSFDRLLYTQLPVTIERCRFENNSAHWFDVAPVGPDGKALSVSDLVNMTMKTVTWKPQALPAVPEAPEAQEDGMIHVTNAEELVAAIGSDREIYLEPGDYVLSKSELYGQVNGDDYYWSSVFDGYELVIENVRNLTLRGAGADQVQILTTPRYANVLSFINCENIALNGITLGHTEAPGECAGGVLHLLYTDTVAISDCSLFGCGILGIRGEFVRWMDVDRTEIHDCSDGAVWLFTSDSCHFRDCNIHDNGSNLYVVEDCTDILLDDEPMVTLFTGNLYPY